MATEQFDKAWDELSQIQKDAAKWGEGPLLVLAGPGSGKTRVLTCRIARILDSNSHKRFRVLGLTFTNKAADEMRSRVANFVPGLADRVFLSTFHSFCSDVLRQHGTHLRINPNFHIYSRDADLQAVLNDAVEDAKKMTDGSVKITDLDKKTLPVIKNLKSRLILPDKVRGFFRDEEFGERMAVVYPAYEAELAKRNALDFNSLILEAYKLFSQFPNLAKRYRTVYSYICIDEFQDTTPAQYSMIRALTGGQYDNLFVVADDDQIIYQWNGASHKRLEELIRDYSPEVIQLPMNYRCPFEVVELANNLIRHNFLRTANKRPLEAFHPHSGFGTVRLLPRFPDFEAEAAGVGVDIKRLHAGESGSVAVLARSRRLLDGVQQALRKEGLPAVISQRKDEFESTPFRWLYSTLCLANDRQDQDSLEAVCGAFAQMTEVEIDPEDVVIQARASNRDYLQYWLKLALAKTSNASVKQVISQTSRFLGEGRDFRAFCRFALDWFSQLAQVQTDAEADPAIERFAGYAEERLVWEELSREIIRSLGDEVTLDAFLQELQMRSKEPTPKPDTVILMTIHGAKGKEFDHVYLIGLVESELPSFQSKQKGSDSPEMEEERRNCFVAITRTMRKLTLSYAERYHGWPKSPSRFLHEMGLLEEHEEKV